MPTPTKMNLDIARAILSDDLMSFMAPRVIERAALFVATNGADAVERHRALVVFHDIRRSAASFADVHSRSHPSVTRDILCAAAVSAATLIGSGLLIYLDPLNIAW